MSIRLAVSVFAVALTSVAGIGARAETSVPRASSPIAPIAARTGAPVRSTQIWQQRTADGRAVLTDRPLAGATTERAWQFDAEDPAAARQRAFDVKAEAHAVSERVRQTIAQQRFADEEALSRRLAYADVERTRRLDDEAFATGGTLLLAPGGFFDGGRGYGRRGDFFGGVGGWGRHGDFGGHGGYGRRGDFGGLGGFGRRGDSGSLGGYDRRGDFDSRRGPSQRGPRGGSSPPFGRLPAGAGSNGR